MNYPKANECDKSINYGACPIRLPKLMSARCKQPASLMSTTMTRVDSQVLSRALERKPHYLSATGFISQLIEQALDSAITLGKASPASAGGSLAKGGEAFTSNNPVTTTYVVESAKKEKKKAPQPKWKGQYTDDFGRFWVTYQASPRKANGQSKPKAFEAWREATKKEAPDRLIQAAQRAVKEVERLVAADEFCAPLPDAYRWLRDGRYEVHLEDHTPQPQRQLTEEEEEAKHLEYLRSMGLA